MKQERGSKRGGQATSIWSPECQKAFQEIKEYVFKMPTLRQPTKERSLLLYIAIGEKAVSSALVQEDDWEQKWPVYFVSKSLHRAKLNYRTLEKAVYAVVFSYRRLKPYFLGFLHHNPKQSAASGCLEESRSLRKVIKVEHQTD